jgi:hypothetical protein
MMLLFAGDLATATGLTEEGRAVIDATSSQFAPYAAMGLAALRGRQAEVSALIEATANDVTLRGEGIAMSVADWANALLPNGLTRAIPRRCAPPGRPCTTRSTRVCAIRESPTGPRPNSSRPPPAAG